MESASPIVTFTAADPAGSMGAFFARAKTPLAIVDRDTRVVAINTAATAVLGIAPGDSLLDGFWSVSETAVMRVLDGARREIEISPISARTASDRLVEVDAFTLDADGELVGVMVADRSSIDDAQQRLAEQEARFRSLFEWSPVAMREEDFSEVGTWLDRLRAEGVVDLAAYLHEHPEEVEAAIYSIVSNRVNAATVELLNAPSTAAVLRGFRKDELTPQVVDSFVAQFITLWNGGSEHESDFVGVDFNGYPFECRLRWIVPRTPSGRDLSRVVVTIVDLTELRSANRRLERLVSDKDRFIASVSHELRTPLAAVFGMSEELFANWDNFGEEELRELVGMVASQSAELTAIVEDLLVAANLESGKVAISSERLELNEMVDAAVADCLRTYPDMAAPEVSGPRVDVLADPIRVRQIVRNLVTNAVRYGGESIVVRMVAGNHPYLEVVDDGDGVPLEHRESIFDAYFQAAEGAKVLGSLGLGLSISRELARRMGGDLTYSYDDGHSVFRLLLPVA